MKSITTLYKKFNGQKATFFASGPSSMDFNKYDEIIGTEWYGMNYIFEKIGIEKLSGIFIHDYSVFSKISDKIPSNKLIIPEEPGLNH